MCIKDKERHCYLTEQWKYIKREESAKKQLHLSTSDDRFGLEILFAYHFSDTLYVLL